MRRRSFLHSVSLCSTIGLTGLAGCTALDSGTSWEVVENDVPDRLSVAGLSLENATRNGTEYVRAEVTIENATDETVPVDLITDFYDGETTVGTDDATRFTNEHEIEPAASQRVTEAIEGRKADVSRLGISVELVGDVSGREVAPDVQFYFEFDKPTDGRFELTHDGGERVNLDQCSLVGAGVATDCSLASGTVFAGDSVLASGACDYDAGGNTIKLLWKGENGDTARVLAETTIPK